MGKELEKLLNEARARLEEFEDNYVTRPNPYCMNDRHNTFVNTRSFELRQEVLRLERQIAEGGGIMKHTPKPWRRVAGFQIEGPTGKTLAECFGRTDEAAGNAALMAAAPELLEALERIANHGGSDSDGITNEWTEAAAFSDCQEIAQAAIAKAEGSERA